MKGKIKKLFAVGASVALLATTMVGALADLSNYPAPFVDDDGVFNGAIVVGESAATSDVLGAIDIAASLQAEAKEAVATGGAEVSVEGGKDMKAFLNAAVTGITLDDGDLEGFKDDSMDINETDYDFHEEIIIGSSQLGVWSSSETAYGEDYTYALDPYMELQAGDGGLQYNIIFDDTVPQAQINDDGDVDLSFLGQALTITSFTPSATKPKVVLETSNEYYMIEGDVKTVGSHDITLVSVGDGTVIVDVDGETHPVASGNTETFDDANNFKVKVGTIFYRDSGTNNGASLTLGSSITDTYEDGDALEIFDGEDESSDATWIWNIQNDSSGNLYKLGIELNIKHNKVDAAPEKDDRNALAMGEEFFFPNNYASLVFAGWDDNEMGSFDTLEIDFETEDLYLNDGSAKIGTWGDDAEVISFKSSADEPFTVDSDDTDAVYMWQNATGVYLFYDDGEDVIMADTSVPATGFTLTLDADPVTIKYDEPNELLNVSFTNGDYMTLDLQNDTTGFDAIGNDDGNADAGEFNFYTGTANILATDDTEVKTTYGAYFTDAESMVEDDEVVLNIPHAAQKAVIVAKSMGTTVSAGATGDAYMVRPIEVGLGMLDSEASLGSKPMIVIGGPYANTIAAELLGNPTDEEIAATFTEGKAMIKWFEADQAMLVAGWSAQDTLGGAYVVADYEGYDFMGMELEAVVTSLDNIVVNPVN